MYRKEVCKVRSKIIDTLARIIEINIVIKIYSKTKYYTEDLELYCIYNEHGSYVSTIVLEKEELVINGEVINYYHQTVDEE